MRYEVVIPEPVEDEVRDWDSDRQEAFFKKIDKLRSFPTKYGKPLRGSLAGIWGLYFEGSFRILYEVENRMTKSLSRRQDTRTTSSARVPP